LKDQLDLLIKIQNIDTNIKCSEEFQAKYQQEMAIIENEESTEEEKCKKQKEELESLTKEHRSRERALDEMLDQKKKLEDRLFAIKTNKEYQASLQEINAVKDSIQKHEDAVLEVMEKLELTRTSLQESEGNLQKNKKIYSQKRGKLEKNLKEHLKDIEEQQKRRKLLESEMDPKTLKDYQSIKEIRLDLAVVMANNEKCAGCNMKIPPQCYNEVLTGNAITLCPNCSRILYVKIEEQK
jgi:predicted  nucleic acid-binding Zn-ribbon protein